jgi:stage III sporulation protein AA
VIRYSNKNYALNYGIKSMSPDILFMDELMCEDDFMGIDKARLSGVNVIATIHSDNISNVIKKFTRAKEIFDYFIVLNNNKKPGEILGVFDNNLNEI